MPTDLTRCGSPAPSSSSNRKSTLQQGGTTHVSPKSTRGQLPIFRWRSVRGYPATPARARRLLHLKFNNHFFKRKPIQQSFLPREGRKGAAGGKAAAPASHPATTARPSRPRCPCLHRGRLGPWPLRVVFPSVFRQAALSSGLYGLRGASPGRRGVSPSAPGRLASLAGACSRNDGALTGSPGDWLR